MAGILTDALLSHTNLWQACKLQMLQFLHGLHTWWAHKAWWAQNALWKKNYY